MRRGEFTNAHLALAEFWHPMALSREVGEEPMAVRLAGQDWALARFGGAIAAFADACPHRRARLSAGRVIGGALQCTYHGWRFASDGRCVDIPALGADAAIPERAALRRPAEVTERDGLVWLALKPPRAPLPELALPELAPGVPLGGDAIATVHLPVVRVEANAAILIDNFLDEAHLPFVHAATIGGAGPEPIPRAEVTRHGLSFTAARRPRSHAPRGHHATGGFMISGPGQEMKGTACPPARSRPCASEGSPGNSPSPAATWWNTGQMAISCPSTVALRQ